MGIYSNVVSTVKPITSIRTFIGGTAKDIKSIWTFVNGQKKMIYPDNSVVLNLSGSSKYEENTIWPAGKYNIKVQAGSSVSQSSTSYGLPQTLLSGKIDVDITVANDFIIRAYCGSKASSGTSAGTNPYSGTYKVNGNISYGSNVASVNHIFGNAGSCCRLKTGSTDYYPSSGNCLGDGVSIQNYNHSCATGAGSCLHFLPTTGTFGTDYLFAFHTTAAGGGLLWKIPNQGNQLLFGGSGSAYGGAGSGCSNDVTLPSVSYNGGSTPYGTGGTGVSGGTQAKTKPGNNGTGIGHGFGGGVFSKDSYNPGAACYFDGSQWVESSLVGGANEDGKIIITYLG